MFELAISNNQNSPFILLSKDKYGFSKRRHERISFTNSKIAINGLRYNGEKDDYIESTDYFIAIVGKAYNRLTFSSNLAFVNAEEVLKLYQNYRDAFVSKLKGNFIILIYSKSKDQLIIVKDALGLKYLYHKSERDKFYISTNLNDFKKVTQTINYAAVFEKILFTYPIGDESYLEDVFMLQEGEILYIENGIILKDSYCKINDIFAHKTPLKKIEKKTFLNIFEKSVLQRASVANNINASLTGGFDGRSNVAVLLNHNMNFHAYSFGKQGGENTNVPIYIAKKLGLDYSPIFLEEDYEHNYITCALDAIYFSDGISIFERANYIYALQKLTKYSCFNITGLIAGEIFAPVHLKTDYINNTYFDIIYLGKDYSIDALLLEKGIKKFIKDEITGNKFIYQKIEYDIEVRRKKVSEWKNDEFAFLYYLKDLISLGFRHFYGNQMHLERFFNENLSPFYDIDIMEYIFSTNHVLTYQNAFKDSIFLRMNNRKLQTWIIGYFSKALAKIPVDRGYPPTYLTDIRKLLIPFFFYKRRFKLKNTATEFNTPVWSKILYQELSNNVDLFSDNFLNTTITVSELEKYCSSKYNKTFNHMLSVAIWLKH